MISGFVRVGCMGGVVVFGFFGWLDGIVLMMWNWMLLVCMFR